MVKQHPVDQRQPCQAERREVPGDGEVADRFELLGAIGEQVDQAGAEEDAAREGVAERKEPAALIEAAGYDGDHAADKADDDNRDSRQRFDGEQAHRIDSTG